MARPHPEAGRPALCPSRAAQHATSPSSQPTPQRHPPGPGTPAEPTPLTLPPQTPIPGPPPAERFLAGHRPCTGRCFLNEFCHFIYHKPATGSESAGHDANPRFKPATHIDGKRCYKGSSHVTAQQAFGRLNMWPTALQIYASSPQTENARTCAMRALRGPPTAGRIPRPARPVRMRASGCYQIIGEVTGRRPGRGRIHHDIRR